MNVSERASAEGARHEALALLGRAIMPADVGELKMKRIALAAFAAFTLFGSATAWANCNSYTTGGCNNNGGSQWGQTENGFGGGETHKCVTTCNRDGTRCETHCY
jgi:hypothetical protein